MKDINGDNRQIIRTIQDQIDYLMEFIEIQGEILEEKTGGRQPELSIEQKKRLAHRGKKLNEFLLGQIENTFAPSTVLKWYSELISDKYNSTGENQKKRGKKPIKDEIVAEVLRLAENKPNIFLPFRNVFPLLYRRPDRNLVVSRITENNYV